VKAMNKINGYTEEEAKSLIEYIYQGKKAGKTLSSLFETYGKKNGRAKGSVRNYYYALMKNPHGDKRVVKMLEGKDLFVEKIQYLLCYILLYYLFLHALFPSLHVILQVLHLF
jgi:hypothetical protein